MKLSWDGRVQDVIESKEIKRIFFLLDFRRGRIYGKLNFKDIFFLELEWFANEDLNLENFLLFYFDNLSFFRLENNEFNK